MELKSVREPFCLEWKISNLCHWSEEVHGRKLETIVDYDHGRRVEFTLCKGCALILVYPPVLWSCKGQLVIRGSDGRVFCSMEKRKGIALLQFEQCEGNHDCVLSITLENACENRRFEYATTVLQPLPRRMELEVVSVIDDMGRQSLILKPHRLDPLNSSREPQLVRQPIPSLESLAIGQVSNQPSNNDLSSAVQGSMEDRVPRFYNSARRRGRLHTIIQIPTIKQPGIDLSTARLAIGQGSNQPLKSDLPSTIQWSTKDRVWRHNSVSARLMRRAYPFQKPTIQQPSTASPTHEQLMLSLGSLSISQEVKASSSDQPS